MIILMFMGHNTQYQTKSTERKYKEILFNEFTTKQLINSLMRSQPTPEQSQSQSTRVNCICQLPLVHHLDLPIFIPDPI